MRTGLPPARQVWSSWSGLAKHLHRPPGPGGQLEVKSRIRIAEIVAGNLADPPEAVLQGAAVY